VSNNNTLLPSFAFKFDHLIVPKGFFLVTTSGGCFFCPTFFRGFCSTQRNFRNPTSKEDGSADLDMVEKVKFLLAGVKMRLRRAPRSGGTISMAQTDLESMRKVLDDGLKTRQKRLVQLRSILQEPITHSEFSCVGY